MMLDFTIQYIVCLVLLHCRDVRLGAEGFAAGLGFAFKRLA